MNSNLQAKIRYYAYTFALIMVAFAAIYGFYQKSKSNNTAEETTQSTESVSYLTDPSLTIEDGDKVNIDFVGYVDGSETENGSTNGEGVDITVGNGKLMSEIEEQLIGHHPGENYTFDIVFGDDYNGDKDLIGKTATIEMTINGIYEK